jgi:Lysozyme like domain
MREHPFRAPSCVYRFWLAPLGAAVLLVGMTITAPTPAAAAGGADLCAQVGSRAGFARSGALVTAVAVGMAESGCSTAAVHRNGPTPGCPRGSVDRGMWQINDCHHPGISVGCARSAQCSANAAFQISSGGRTFRPWAAYTNGRYRAHLGQARAAVGRLRG